MPSPADYTTLTVAVAALVTAIFTGIAGIIVALRSKSQTIAAVEEVHAEAKVITGHVNSAAAAASAKAESMQKQIDIMTVMISDAKLTAAVLAQSKADVAVLAPVAAVVEIKPVSDAR